MVNTRCWKLYYNTNKQVELVTLIKWYIMRDGTTQSKLLRTLKKRVRELELGFNVNQTLLWRVLNMDMEDISNEKRVMVLDVLIEMLPINEIISDMRGFVDELQMRKSNSK